MNDGNIFNTKIKILRRLQQAVRLYNMQIKGGGSDDLVSSGATFGAARAMRKGSRAICPKTSG